MEPPSSSGGRPVGPEADSSPVASEADDSLNPEAPAPPRPRGAVERAHRVPRGITNRKGYLRLDLGESDRPASPQVLKTLQQLNSDDLAHYPDPQPLEEALARTHAIKRTQITVTAGADEAIRLVFQAYVEEGARILIPRPTLGAVLAAASAAGAFVERVDYGEDLSFPLEAFTRALSPRTPRMAVLSNPDAPTGTALDPTDILGLAKASEDTLFLINESFAAYNDKSLLDPEYGPLPPNVLILRSFSKDHGLAGLRVGYLAGHPAVIEAINIIRPSFTISSPSLIAALAALEEREAMQAHVLNLRSHMERLVAKLSVRGVDAIATRANFVLVRLTAPIQPWAAAFAAHEVLVGISGHVGPMAPYIRVTVNREEDSQRFLDTLDLLLRQGVAGSQRVEQVPGNWDELGEEGLA